MAKRRQLAMMSVTAGSPLGSRSDIREALARFNTGDDGSGAASIGLERFHGPGIVVDVPTSADPVAQAMVSVVEDDIAWPVLTRICREMKWKMVDIETGRTFGS